MPYKIKGATTPAGIPAPEPEVEHEPDTYWGGFLKGLKGLVPAGIRAGSGLIGSTVAAEPGMGTLVGGGIGGAGEFLAELAEGSEPNLKRIGAEAALTAVPLGKIYQAGRPLGSALKGAAYSGAGIVGRQMAEGQPVHIGLPEAANIGFGGALGGLFGTLSPTATREVTKATEPLVIEQTAAPFKEGGRGLGGKTTAFPGTPEAPITPTEPIRPPTAARPGVREAMDEVRLAGRGKYRMKGEIAPEPEVGPTFGPAEAPTTPRIPYGVAEPAPYRASALRAIREEQKAAEVAKKAAEETEALETIRRAREEQGLQKERIFSDTTTAPSGPGTKETMRTRYVSPPPEAEGGEGIRELASFLKGGGQAPTPEAQAAIDKILQTHGTPIGPAGQTATVTLEEAAQPAMLEKLQAAASPETQGIGDKLQAALQAERGAVPEVTPTPTPTVEPTTPSPIEAMKKVLGMVKKKGAIKEAEDLLERGPGYQAAEADIIGPAEAPLAAKAAAAEVPQASKTPEEWAQHFAETGQVDPFAEANARLIEARAAQPTTPVVPEVAPQAPASPVSELAQFFKTKKGATGKNYRLAKEAEAAGEIPSAQFAREAHMREGLPAPTPEVAPQVQAPKTYAQGASVARTSAVQRAIAREQEAARAASQGPPRFPATPETVEFGTEAAPAGRAFTPAEEKAYAQSIREQQRKSPEALQKWLGKLKREGPGASLGERKPELRGPKVASEGTADDWITAGPEMSHAEAEAGEGAPELFGGKIPGGVAEAHDTAPFESVKKVVKSISPETLQQPGGIKETAKNIFQKLPQIVRFNYLMSAVGLPANALFGPYGSAVMGALEHGLSGDARGWNLLKEMSPRAFLGEWKNAKDEAIRLIMEGEMGRAEMTAGVTPTEKILASPGVAMTAGDVAARKFLERAGFTEAEARRITMTMEAETPAYRRMVDAPKGNVLMNMLFPFRRTPMNIWEQGTQRLPGIGSLVQSGRDIPDPIKQQLVQQLVMTPAVGGASYLAGENLDPENAKIARRFISNFAGQYGLPSAIGFAAGQAAQRGAGAASQTAAGALGGMRDLPLPTTSSVEDLINFLKAKAEGGEAKIPGGLVPAFLREEVPVLGAGPLAPSPKPFSIGRYKMKK